MDSAMEQSLSRAAAFIFENVTFLETSEQLDGSQSAAAPEAEAQLDFAGPFAGTLRLRVCGGLLPVLSSAMLGGDPPEEWMQLDALGEISNMICGGLLPMIAPEKVFSQTSPTTACVGPEEVVADAPTAVARLGVERGRAEILLYLREA